MSTRTPTPTTTFADFGVDAAIVKSLADVGITSPFPIQEMTLPLALTGADIIGQARTGTGKTLGFGLPLLQRIDVDGGLQALVIVPTRELCVQVAEDLAQAGRGRGVDVVALYGGKAMQPQIEALEAGAHLVVGTPGRLLDLSRRGHLDLSSCAGLVLDEADEMLDLGFLPDVEALIEQCREQRQTLLFSATMPAAIVSLARRYMSKPTFMRADVEEVNIAPATQQYFFSCHRMDKPAVLARVLQTPDRGLCVVFCRTKRMADILAEELRDRDVAAQAIHSDLRQESRERVLQKFRDGKVTVLCATEVAARGLDIDDVTHVVNYDCPDDEKMYLHRIGRTGRAGAKGVAITFAVWNELPRLEMIRRELDIEEEVHEVFSTSPLLDELFDLPAREERKKVPSPPQARSGKGSRSKRRGEKAEDEQDRASRRGGGRDEDRDADDDGDRSRSRRRTRTREDAEAGPADADADGATETAEEGDDDRGGRTRTRTRTRTRRTSGGGGSGRGTRDEATGSDDDDGDDAVVVERRTAGSDRRRPGFDRANDEGRGDRKGDRRKGGRASDDERSGGDRSSEGRSSGRDQERAGGDGGDDRGADDRGGRSRSRRGGRGKGGSRDQSSRDQGGRDQGGRDQGGRDGAGRSGGRGKGGGRDQGSRDQGSRGEGGRGKRSGRDQGGRSNGRSRSRQVVDHEEARGEGRPRLNRTMVVEHLP